MKSKPLFSFLLLSLVLFTACGKKIPAEYKALAGTWQNDEVYMKISEDGGFSYKRKSKGEEVSIETWITEYTDKGFTVSVVFGSTDFVLDRKPYFDQSSKTTKMIVDGRTLVKQDTW